MNPHSTGNAQSNSTLKLVALILGVVIGLPFLLFILVFLTGIYGWNQAVRSGNEAAAGQSVYNLRKFQALYAGRYRGNFGTFDELIEKAGLDGKFRGEAPIVHGYKFQMDVFPASYEVPGGFYSLTADPVNSVGKHFYTDSRIRYVTFTSENRPARPDDPSHPGD